MDSVTITDVAKKAGVSLATVSRVLSGKNPVRPQTKEKVMAAIKELNYKPNALARQLRTQQTYTIVVIVPDIGNYLYHGLIHGIEAEAQNNGYQVLVADVKGQPSIENYYFQAIQGHAIDGIISASANVTRKILQQIAGEYPMVMALQQVPDSMVPSVTINNAAAMRDITNHLIRLGHREIAYISSSSRLFLYDRRYEGFQEALRNSGLSLDSSLVHLDEPSMQGGYNCAMNLLNSGKRFTAIVAAGDSMALGAIKALKENDVRVPEDVAVVGIDDLDISRFWDPGLTTVRQPLKEIGQRSFHKLLAMINGEPVPRVNDILPYELVIRQSCGAYLPPK